MTNETRKTWTATELANAEIPGFTFDPETGEYSPDPNPQALFRTVDPSCIVGPVGGYSARRWCSTHKTYVENDRHSVR